MIKLKDKIGLLKFWCVAGLGETLWDKAYKLVKVNWEKNIQADRTWETLIELIGKENIGFWAIIDNVLFLEEKKKEISSVKSS